jgi:hypothetical protein
MIEGIWVVRKSSLYCFARETKNDRCGFSEAEKALAFFRQSLQPRLRFAADLR